MPVATLHERLTRIADDLEAAVNNSYDTKFDALNVMRFDARQAVRELRLEAIAQRQAKETVQ